MIYDLDDTEHRIRNLVTDIHMAFDENQSLSQTASCTIPNTGQFVFLLLSMLEVIAELRSKRNTVIHLKGTCKCAHSSYARWVSPLPIPPIAESFQSFTNESSRFYFPRLFVRCRLCASEWIEEGK